VVFGVLPLFSQVIDEPLIVRFSLKPVLRTLRRCLLSRVVRIGGIAATSLTLGLAAAGAQTIEVRQWQGATAVTRQPEQVVARTNAEWRSLWTRVGVAAPDFFEPGRTSAVGIFLGARSGEGYLVNVLSASRRRDRIMVVFEERSPDANTAQRLRGAPPATAGTAVPNSGAFAKAAPSGSSPTTNFAPPSGPVASLPSRPSYPETKSTSPWAIVLINRADLPLSVEQRWFR